MRVYINGNVIEFSQALEPITIELVLAKALTTKQRQQSFALALNGDFVGWEEYANTLVKDSDSIDILLPIVGG